MYTRSSKPRSFVVIGLGHFGSAVATELSLFGNRVLGIDADAAVVSRVASSLETCIIANARDVDALVEAGMEGYDVAIVAVGEDFEASILSTIAAKKMGIREVWVRARTPNHKIILQTLGADRVVEPQNEMGRQVAQLLHAPAVLDFVETGDGGFIYVLRVGEPLVGRTIRDVLSRQQRKVSCVGVLRADQLVDAHLDAPLATGDRLLLFGSQADLQSLAQSL